MKNLFTLYIMQQLLYFLFLYIWSLNFEAIFLLASRIGLLRHKSAKHIQLRQLLHKDLPLIKKNRSKSSYCYCFWCSSAGEYEQALPLIKKLNQHNNNNNYILIIFFSKSGYDYAFSRNEQHPYYLASHDSIFFWERFFKALQPQETLVVRHELWPAFLFCANKYSTLTLINASVSKNLPKSYFNIKTKQFLLSYFNHIFVISKEDYHYFHDHYKFTQKKLTISNDTKYESAYQRASNNPPKLICLQKKLTYFGSKNHRLIAGSAWKKDIELILDSLVILKKKKKAQVLLVPHKITTNLIEKTISSCIKRKLSYIIFDPNLEKIDNPSPSIDVIIINAMGLLAELYSCASFAYVGGGMHYQVHNVLEPLASGLNIAFGPYYENSPEARHLIANNIAQVIKKPRALADWWSQKIQQHHLSKTHAYFKKQLGASDCILNQLLSRHQHKEN